MKKREAFFIKQKWDLGLQKRWMGALDMGLHWSGILVSLSPQPLTLIYRDNNTNIAWLLLVCRTQFQGAWAL